MGPTFTEGRLTVFQSKDSKKINRNLKENDTILDKEDKDVVKYSNFEEDESNNNNELIYNY